MFYRFPATVNQLEDNRIIRPNELFSVYVYIDAISRTANIILPALVGQPAHFAPFGPSS